MSSHQVASFTTSCVIAPRHPKTKLPTTVSERKSIDLNEVSFHNENVITNGKSETKSFKNKEQKKSVNTENVFWSYENPVRTDEIKDEVFSKSKSSYSRPATAPCKNQMVTDEVTNEENGFPLFDTRTSMTLQNLIDNDDQFFKHLQYLKRENKKTLKILENLYSNSLTTRRKGSDYTREDATKTTQEPLRHTHIKDDRLRDAKRSALYRSLRINDSTGGVQDKNREISVEDLDESSEDELDEQLKVQVPGNHVNILPESEDEIFRGRSSSYDIISNMWENFSVDEYVPYTRTKNTRNKKEWSPTVTIPEPFQMTIRDERKAKQKSKRIEKIEEEKLQKKLLEEVELSKKIVPTPVPPSTFLPLYEEIKEHKEQKREYVRALSKEILKCNEKPFTFIKREEAKKELRRSNFNLQKIMDEKKETFKANPYPEKLFDLSLADRIAEQEEYRKIKIKLRSEEMLASSSLPGNMKTRGNMRYYPIGEKTKRAKEDLKKRKEHAFKPRIHHDIPDFEILQKKFENELNQMKTINTVTVCKPFQLHTAKIPSRRSKFKESVEMKNVSERPPSGHSRSQTPNRSRSFERSVSTPFRSDRSPSISRRGNSPAISLNETTRLRHEKIRQSIENSNKDSLRRTGKELEKLKQQQIVLQKKISKKAQVNDPARNRTKDMVEKLRSFREADNMRRKEYQDYLMEMDAKLDSRPLLFERESQTNARRKAQKRYEEILEQAGVKGEILQSVLNASCDVSGEIESEPDSEQEDPSDNEMSNQRDTEDGSPDNDTYDKAYNDEDGSDNDDDEKDPESSHDGSYVASSEDEKADLSDDEI